MTTPTHRQRIAVIGGGIAGLSAAWALAPVHDVMLFEADSRLGGHANSVDIVLGTATHTVDTGFIVFNDWTYPNLIALFQHLGVGIAPSNMSFGVSLDDGAFEYASTPEWSALFAQRRNILRPYFWRMLLDMKRFYAAGPTLDTQFDLNNYSLGQMLSALNLSDIFITKHIMPMCACIWSGSFSDMLSFPARTFVQFFKNHGLFLLKGRPQWRTVEGGSRTYVAALARAGLGQVQTGQKVCAVIRSDQNILVHIAERPDPIAFDQVVLATHGDTACRLVQTPTAEEAAILPCFKTSQNKAFLHQDTRAMPHRRAVWSSWNYIGRSTDLKTRAVPITYWMNRLQNLASDEDVFVSLNPQQPLDPHKIIYETDYTHPIFDETACRAQKKQRSIQGIDRLWYCGAYWGYGFHEDGCRSGLDVARQLGASIPWEPRS